MRQKKLHIYGSAQEDKKDVQDKIRSNYKAEYEKLTKEEAKLEAELTSLQK